jgi:hypothetical protein
MKTRYYLPSRVKCPDDLSADEKARLERSILEALRRGIAAAAGEMPEITVADFALPETASEFFSSSRYHADRDTYAVPSYQEGGAPVELPVERITSEEETEQTAGSLGLEQPQSIPERTQQEKLNVIRWKRKSIPPHLKAGILTRAPIRLPAEKVRWLLDVASKEGVRWVKRLAIDLPVILPEVDMTLELFRVQDPSLTNQDLTTVFEKYLEQRHEQELKNFKFFAGRWFFVKDRSYFESALGLSFNELFKQGGLPLPESMGSKERRRHALLVYASLPEFIESFMVPESVIAAQEAIEAALKQEPIGRLDEILKNPELFKDKLEGPDDRLVVVLVGEAGHDERKVLSLRVLRHSIQSVEHARRNPLLIGFFRRDAPATVRSLDPRTASAPSLLVYRMSEGEVPGIEEGIDGRIVVRCFYRWEFPELGAKSNWIIENREFKSEDTVALRIGGPRFDQVPDPAEEAEILVPAELLPEVIPDVLKRFNLGVSLQGAFRELEHFTEAITIYQALATAGQLAGAGQAGLATLRKAGSRALAAQAGQALLTRAGVGLAVQTVLDIVLPAVTFYVVTYQEELKKTAAGQAFIKAVDGVNTALAVFGLAAIATLGALRLMRARMQRLKQLKQTEESAKMITQMEDEVDDLTRQAREAVGAKTMQINMPAAIRSRMKEQIAEQLKKLKHRVAFDEPEKMKEVILALNSVDTPANKRLRELLKPVWEGLHDPDLIADVVTDVWWQASKFSKKEATEWGVSELTLGAMDLALKETEGTLEVLTSQLDPKQFLQEYVAKKLFLDLGAGTGHGWTSHLIQDIVVDRVLKKIDPGLSATQLRTLISRAEGTKPLYELRVSVGEKAPLGSLIFEQLYDESTKYAELGLINEPEALMDALRDLEELKTLQ